MSRKDKISIIRSEEFASVEDELAAAVDQLDDRAAARELPASAVLEVAPDQAAVRALLQGSGKCREQNCD